MSSLPHVLLKLGCSHIKRRLGVPLWCSGLSIRHCHCYSVGSIPGLGTSTCSRCGQKERGRKRSLVPLLESGWIWDSDETNRMWQKWQWVTSKAGSGRKMQQPLWSLKHSWWAAMLIVWLPEAIVLSESTKCPIERPPGESWDYKEREKEGGVPCWSQQPPFPSALLAPAASWLQLHEWSQNCLPKCVPNSWSTETETTKNLLRFLKTKFWHALLHSNTIGNSHIANKPEFGATLTPEPLLPLCQ